MKRILTLIIPLAFLAGCGAPKKGCKDTGCGAGTECNAVTGACELPNVVGGGGGQTGGGAGGGGAGGGTGAGGGGGGTADAGVDAGPPVDPFDDGGVFVPGDICSNAIPVSFDGGLAGDGGSSTVVTLTVDLAQATSQYAAACNGSSGDGNDLLFEVTLAEAKGLIVTATDTSGKSQDAVLSLVTSPCPLLAQAACVDSVNDPEVLALERLRPGRYFVLLENYADDNADDGTYEVQFELVDPVAAPPNDECSSATALTFTNGTVTVTGTTVGAFNDTASSPLTCSARSGIAPEVFYSVTLTQPQDVTVTVTTPMGSSLSPAIALTNVCGQGGAPNQRGCRTGSGGTFTARSVPAGTFFIVVDGNSASPGDFSLEVTLTPPTPLPVNDTCAMPTTLVPNMSVMVDANAGSQDYVFSCSAAMGGDAVYQFTTTMPQRVTLTATGMGGADGVLSLRAAPCDTDDNEVNCVDSPGGGPDVLTANNLPAGTYFVVLAAYSPASGQFGLELLLEPPRPPPANESCANAEVVALVAGTATRFVDLTEATADQPSDLCAMPADGADVVYEVVIPPMQTLTVVGTPVGAVLDVVLFAKSPVCAMATSEVCTDVGFSGDPDTLIVPNGTAAMKTVFVVVKAYDLLDPGEINLTFTAM